MRKYVLLLFVALTVVVTACGADASPTVAPTVAPETVEETVQPSALPNPTVVPSPTQAGSEPEDTLASPVPSDGAACQAAAADFPVAPGLSPVTEADHIRGNENASITLIEYSDFQ